MRIAIPISDVRHAGATDTPSGINGSEKLLADPLLIRLWLQWKNLKERFMWAA